MAAKAFSFGLRYEGGFETPKSMKSPARKLPWMAGEERCRDEAAASIGN